MDPIQESERSNADGAPRGPGRDTWSLLGAIAVSAPCGVRQGPVHSPYSVISGARINAPRLYSIGLAVRRLCVRGPSVSDVSLQFLHPHFVGWGPQGRVTERKGPKIDHIRG